MELVDSLAPIGQVVRLEKSELLHLLKMLLDLLHNTRRTMSATQVGKQQKFRSEEDLINWQVEELEGARVLKGLDERGITSTRVKDAKEELRLARIILGR